jgi:hypothetical protein
MHRFLLLAGLALGAAPLLAADPGSPGAPAAPILPARLPGYELRTLDERKAALINANGAWVEASLPVFCYFPSADGREAAGLVRRAYEQVVALSRKSEWTAAELQEVIAGLEHAVRLLEPPADARPPAP